MSLTRLPFSIIILSLCILSVVNASDNCNVLKTCSQCIQNPACAWCSDPGLHFSKRCTSKNIGNCTSLEDPKSISVSNKIMVQASSKSSLTLKLRVGEPVNITMTYKDEGNRPLDLYMLMDLSCTMIKHKTAVASLADELVTTLSKLTTGLRIGYGSFIEKPLMPFVDLSGGNAKNSYCFGEAITEAIPHSFHNHLSLTSNADAFREAVNSSKIITNTDSPEATLDALMQVIVCTEKTELNWTYSDKTRRLVVLATDGPFHTAGDGKLAGILLPNDGKCHLDPNGTYSHATVLDYPSVSQIRDVVNENDVLLIFAVTKEQVPLYSRLAEAIGNELASVTEISDDGSSSNIISVIETEYQKIVESVYFAPNTQNQVRIKYYVKCPNDLDFTNATGCEKVSPYTEIEYKVEFTLLECYKKGSENSTLSIHPTSFASKKESQNFLTVKVEPLCQCNCEQDELSPDEPARSRSSPLCNSNGAIVCGICKCNAGFGGRFCNCTLSNETDSSLLDNCGSDGTICSGKGNCLCGKCECQVGFVGQLCECSEFDKCPIHAGDKGPCSSEAGQGTCTCRGCKCAPGFSGRGCECRNSMDTCVDVNSKDKDEFCNNAGNCSCGSCDCGPNFHGQFCEYQSALDPNTGNCKDSLQKSLKLCMNCLVSSQDAEVSTPKMIVSCQSDCKNVKLEEEPDTQFFGLAPCEARFTDDKECELLYISYGKNPRSGEILLSFRKHERKRCPSSPPWVAIFLSVFGSVLLIGILTLLAWKIFTHVHDKREFIKFETERKNQGRWMIGNPLYKDSTSTFVNPSYAPDDVN